METLTSAKTKSAIAYKAGDEFGGAYWALVARDIVGDKWLKAPLTPAERRRRFTEYSDYKANYWTTEPKGAYGVVRCYCGVTVKRKYPWFGAKHCQGGN